MFDAGYDTVDFNVLTYRTGFEQDLVRWYGPTANVTFTDKPEGGAAHLQPAGTRDLVVSVLNSATPYDAVFLTRIDVWFKPAFVAALLAADLSKIVFPFMCGPEMGGCAEELQKPPGSGSCPRISDMFVWIPRAYFSYVLLDQHKFLNNHHTYQTIETLVPGGVEALSTVLRYEMVDSDPMKERNRIYRLAGRVQKKEWGSYMWRNQTAVGTDTFRTSSLHSLLTNEDDSVDPTQRPVPPAVCTRRVQIC